MAFYVPLGLRGILLRLGTLVIGIWGALVYRITYWRRGVNPPRAEPLTVPLAE